jgi:ABC-type branched-subunit amino acid transport system substrate-binding protein
MVEFAKRQGWVRVGVFYARSPGGDSLGSRLISSVEDNNLQLVYSRSYLADDVDWQNQDFRPMIAEIGKDSVDAVMIADQLPRGAKLVADMGRMRMNKPIIGCDKFDDRALWEIAGPAANRVYVASAVDPDATTPEFVAFKQRFRRRWNADPGYGASQGYEAFMVLVEAGIESGTADPLVVATTLRAGRWKGLFGEFTFSSSGDVEGRHLSIKRMEDGRFTTVPFEISRNNP